MDSEKKKEAILGLSLIHGVGYNTLYQMYPLLNKPLDELGDNEAVSIVPISVRNRDKLINNIKKNKLKLMRDGRVLLKEQQEKGIQLIINSEPAFPTALTTIEQPPYWLFVEGAKELLLSRRIATVVGSRSAPRPSLKVAIALSKFLALHGFVILSGLAEGIDKVAHRIALKYNAKTIAVLGHGLQMKMSRTNEKLKEEIIKKGGAVVSEYFPKDWYSRRNFVLRNRLQTGLAQVVFPIHARDKGGTKHTIMFAHQQRRSLVGVKLRGVNSGLNNEVYNILLKLKMPIVELPNDANKLLRMLPGHPEPDEKKDNLQIRLDF
jgi:DNA processing protein